jgi:hypothetical protein
MANPVFETIAATNTGSSSPSLTAPSGIASGDLLLAFLQEDTPATTLTSISGGTTWNSVSGTGFDANGRLLGSIHTTYFKWKIAGGSEPATYTTVTSATWTGVQAVCRISGVHQTTPIDVAAVQETSGSVNHATPSIDPSVNETLIVTCYSLDSTAARTWTQSTGTERLDQSEGTAFTSMSVYSENHPSGHDAISRTGVISTGTLAGIGAIFAIRPPAAGGATEDPYPYVDGGYYPTQG